MSDLYLEDEISCPEDALRLIRAIAVDYDGYKKAESLMGLIDELKDIAYTGLQKGKEE